MNKKPARNDTATTPGHVTLPGECALAGIEGLQKQLLAAQQVAEPVTLDVQGLERVDTASMQLILTFILDRAASERSLRITGSSAAWDEAVNTLGFSNLLLVAA